jgi:hypothetical protein
MHLYAKLLGCTYTPRLLLEAPDVDARVCSDDGVHCQLKRLINGTCVGHAPCLWPLTGGKLLDVRNVPAYGLPNGELRWGCQCAPSPMRDRHIRERDDIDSKWRSCRDDRKG